jgi:hypothetical protein
VVISEDHRHHGNAVGSTREALESPGISAIYEAAFSFEDVRIRVDILERSGGGNWNLVEVKSGISLKDEHLYDVGLQYHVLNGVNLAIGATGILHLNREYLYDGEKLDLEALFKFTDLKAEVLGIQEKIQARLQEMKATVRQKERPRIEPSKHCRRPYLCEFFHHCRKGMPDDWILQLSGIQQDQFDALVSRGIVDIQDIPGSFELSMLQSRIRECVIHRTEYVGTDLGAALRQYAYPIHFLDFETVAPAIPRYPNTHPYEPMPFQWSDHILLEDGALAHKAYLCEEDKDPREEVARTLLEALGEEGTICTYSNYESQVISKLAEHMPKYRDRLHGLLGRCRDLYAEIRRGYYHPEFHGSFSIKDVLTALVPSMSYGTLPIQEGGHASMEYLRMIEPETPPEEKDRICKALMGYCRQDTLAMVKIREELLSRSS